MLQLFCIISYTATERRKWGDMKQNEHGELPRSITLYNELVEAIRKHASMLTVCRAYACYVLACYASNKSKTADVLKLDRRTLHRWEKERLGLPVINE
jgi:hypothetical protein